MDVATISLGALAVAIVVSCTSRIHVGFLAIALAWVVGVYVAGLSANEIMAGFPTRLFLTLTGVTLLFSQAQANGTLDRIAHRAVRYCRGNVGVIPMMFFGLAFMLASIGPGNIASTALVAPMAMAVAGQVGIPAFLIAIMVGNGANAGSLSPIAPTGVIVNSIMADIGMGGFEWHTYLNNMMAHTVIAFTAYFLLGGWKLIGRYHTGAIVVPGGEGSADADWGFAREHYVTLAVIVALIVGVIFFDVHIGLGAFGGAIMLSFLRAGDEMKAVTIMPWRVIMMVCGVTVLIAMMDRTGRPGSVHAAARGRVDTGVGDGRDRLFDRVHFNLQQHLGRRAAGDAADGARPRRAARQRGADCHRVGDERRRAPRGRLRALDARRAVSGGGTEDGGHEAPLQQADGVGPVDDRRRRRGLLPPLHGSRNRDRLIERPES